MRTRQQNVWRRKRNNTAFAAESERFARTDPAFWNMYNQTGYYTDEDLEAVQEGFLGFDDRSPESIDRYLEADAASTPWTWELSGRSEYDFGNEQLGFPSRWGPQDPRMARGDYMMRRRRRGH